MAMFSSEKLPGSVMPLWVFLSILIPLLAFTFYLKHQNLTRRFLLLLYCPTSPNTSTASPYHSILSSILVSRPYHPPYYHIIGFEYHGQLQTSLQFVLRRLGYLYKGLCNLPRVEYERELLTLSDNGLVALDWGYLKKSQQKIFNNNSSTLIIFQHGLGGNSKSEYIVHLAERCLDSSFQVVALVARGCGGLPIQTSTFVPRKTSDLREIIAHIRKTHSHVKNIYYVGYSLGAALGIKYIHEEGKNCSLKGAVAISPPWNMAEPTTVYPIWSRLIVRVLQRYLSKHQELLPNCGVSYTQVRQAKNLAELDQLLIRSYGYDSLEEYYHDNSAIHYTSGIHTPTLVISAEDDPICSIYSHPRGAPVATTEGEGEKATAAGAGSGEVGSLGVGDHGPGLCFVKTSTGGHCAYPQGVLPVTKSWVDDVILDWIQALQLQESDPKSSPSSLGSGTKQGQGSAKGKSNGKGKP